MSYLLTFCAGWTAFALVVGIVVGKVMARNRIDDSAVSKDWCRQQTITSCRNQFVGVTWTWPVKK